MLLTRLLLVLRARWRLGLGLLLAVAALVIGLSLQLPKRYVAQAAVVLDVKSPDPIAGVLLPGMTTTGYMSTQLEVINSERVITKALQAAGLADRPTQRQAWQQATGGAGDYLAWLAVAASARLDAKPARDSNVITIQYAADNPRDAADMANAVMRSYIDTTLELRVEPARQFNNFFDERVKQQRETLGQAQTRLSAYQRQAGLVGGDDKFDIESARLNELSSQQVALQAVAEDSRTRRGAASRNANQMTEVLSSPILITLTAELAKQEGALDELRLRLGDAHPTFQQGLAGIAQLRARIENERRRVTDSVGVNSDVNQTRLALLRQAIHDQQLRLLALKQRRDEMAVLRRDVENAQRAYDAMYSRGTQASMESQITQTNVSVLKLAAMPSAPASPRLLVNGIAGVALGLVLAIAAVLAAELVDARLRAATDISAGLGVPCLGRLPAGAARRVAPRLFQRALPGAQHTLPWRAE